MPYRTVLPLFHRHHRPGPTAHPSPQGLAPGSALDTAPTVVPLLPITAAALSHNCAVAAAPPNCTVVLPQPPPLRPIIHPCQPKSWHQAAPAPQHSKWCCHSCPIPTVHPAPPPPSTPTRPVMHPFPPMAFHPCTNRAHAPMLIPLPLPPLPRPYHPPSPIAAAAAAFATALALLRTPPRRRLGVRAVTASQCRHGYRCRHRPTAIAAAAAAFATALALLRIPPRRRLGVR